jgi:GT2 family glycosyltransferase
LVHGPAPVSPGDFVARLFDTRLQGAAIVWAAGGPPPAGIPHRPDAIEAARELTELRGDRYVAFVRTDTQLARDWLNELVNAIEAAPDTAAALIAAEPDARCTLVAPRAIPQHLRIEPAETFDAAVGTWICRAEGAGRAIARVRRSETLTGEGPRTPALPADTAEDVFVSIVMLSWNAPTFTETAIESIRAVTTIPHEIIIVDNGSGEETTSRLKRIPGIRVIYNAVNTGFAFGNNQGIAAARGTHVVVLNNDVIVTAGWLEAMIAVQRANPAVGCSAPRSNYIAGLQMIPDVPYRSIEAMPAFAAMRSIEERGRWWRINRVIGFCMCLSRRVIEEVGGLDPGYGTGNFEDDDYCVRIRAAGYDIAICEDAFVHHFGHVSFRQNQVSLTATMERNQARFSKRWNVTIENKGYDGQTPWRRGFAREHDYIALPEPAGVGAGWLAPA